MLNWIKRNWIDIMLGFWAVNMLVFCCDAPVIKGNALCEFYDHTGKDFWYDICMALLTTIFIHYVQKISTHFIQIRKYGKIIFIQCMEIAECVKEMVWMITGERDYLNVSKDMLKSKLEIIDIDVTGSKYYVDNRELVLKDALLKVNREMLERIDVILGMPFVNFRLQDVLYEMRASGIHKRWEDMLANANGHLNTIEQEKGNSYGGVHLDFCREEDIAIGIGQFIEKIEEINKILKRVYGFEGSL